MTDTSVFEIIALAGTGESNKARFRAAFDFNTPDDITPLGIKKLKVTGKTLRQILSLPLEEVKKWLSIIPDPPLTFKNFWFFCQRFGNGRFEHGDTESLEKARLILKELVARKIKVEEVPKLHFASYDRKKVLLIQEALLALEAPIHQIPRVEGNRYRGQDITDLWNKWLDEKRDPTNVSTSWGDLVADEDEGEESIKETPEPEKRRSAQKTSESEGHRPSQKTPDAKQRSVTIKKNTKD